MNKQTTAIAVLLLIAIMQSGMGQESLQKAVKGQVYQLPFASAGNAIELTVANTAEVPLTSVTVEAAEVPSWIKFTATEQRIALLKSREEMPVTFTFAVDKSAPVGQRQELRFIVTGTGGEQWEKEITVAVSAPERFELFQNFPNPFNPQTAISFQLSAVSRVSLKIFNMLGQEVASLVDADRAAGFHQEMWDASRYASGMYVVRIVAEGKEGERFVAQRRMLLLK